MNKIAADRFIVNPMIPEKARFILGVFRMHRTAYPLHFQLQLGVLLQQAIDDMLIPVPFVTVQLLKSWLPRQFLITKELQTKLLNKIVLTYIYAVDFCDGLVGHNLTVDPRLEINTALEFIVRAELAFRVDNSNATIALFAISLYMLVDHFR